MVIHDSTNWIWCSIKLLYHQIRFMVGNGRVFDRRPQHYFVRCHYYVIVNKELKRTTIKHIKVQEQTYII